MARLFSISKRDIQTMQRQNNRAIGKSLSFSEMDKLHSKLEKMTTPRLRSVSEKLGIKITDPHGKIGKQAASADIVEGLVGKQKYAAYHRSEEIGFHRSSDARGKNPATTKSVKVTGGSDDQPRDEQGRFTFK